MSLVPWVVALLLFLVLVLVRGRSTRSPEAGARNGSRNSDRLELSRWEDDGGQPDEAEPSAS
jgi:hypothetical protein